MNLKELFFLASETVESACKGEGQKMNLSREAKKDMDTQCSFLLDRLCVPLTREQDIINNFVISASSYSILRRTFKVNSVETIRNFDARFGTNFFSDQIPQYNYSEWCEIVLEWGTKIFPEKMTSLPELSARFQKTYKNGDLSLNKKPEPRIIWTLASGLPVVKAHILKDPEEFHNRYHSVSKNIPARHSKTHNCFLKIKRRRPTLWEWAWRLFVIFSKISAFHIT
jgi:hypothetical protein